MTSIRRARRQEQTKAQIRVASFREFAAEAAIFTVDNYIAVLVRFKRRRIVAAISRPSTLPGPPKEP